MHDKILAQKYIYQNFGYDIYEVSDPSFKIDQPEDGYYQLGTFSEVGGTNLHLNNSKIKQASNIPSRKHSELVNELSSSNSPKCLSGRGINTS